MPPAKANLTPEQNDTQNTQPAESESSDTLTSGTASDSPSGESPETSESTQRIESEPSDPATAIGGQNPPSTPEVKSVPDTYTVKANETLGEVAEKVGVSQKTITQLNPKVNPHMLLTGTKLKLK